MIHEQRLGYTTSDLLFNIVYAGQNFQKTSKTIKRQKQIMRAIKYMKEYINLHIVIKK